MNWYTYASNNPLIFFDPTGLFAEQVDAVVTPNAEINKIGTLGVVEKTDSLDSLAKDFYGDPAMKEVIIAANNLDPDNPVIKPGQVLYIPITREMRDDNGNLKGYSFVDVTRGRKDTSVYLGYKHDEALNRKSSWKYQYAQFGSTTGNAQNDVMGNLAVAAVVFMGVEATSGGTIYATAQKLYFDVGVQTYIAGQQLWNKVSEKGGKILDWAQKGIQRLTGKVPVEKLKMNPEDPFNYSQGNYNAAALSNQRNYIAQNGTITEPILVKKVGESYMILDGHHRYWAAIQMGLKYVPIKVIE